MKLSSIAKHLGVQIALDSDIDIQRLASLGSATEQDLSFAMPGQILSTHAGALILKSGTYPEFDRPRVDVDDVYLAYAKASALFAQLAQGSGIDSSAKIDASAALADDVTVGAGVVIGANVVLEPGVIVGPGCVIEANAKIGAGTQLKANVTVYHASVVGRDCLIHSGVVLGADGFGFAPSAQGWIKIHQLGRTIIGDDCEIGANTCIDRGALDDTTIGRGVKIDNQVMIAHNCSVGDYTAIAACVGMAGSTHIGAHCTIAGAAGFTGHITICDKVHVGAMTLVAGDITQPGAYAGGVQGARDMRKWKRNVARFNQLDDLAKRLIRLEKMNSNT